MSEDKKFGFLGKNNRFSFVILMPPFPLKSFGIKSFERFQKLINNVVTFLRRLFRNFWKIQFSFVFSLFVALDKNFRRFSKIVICNI